MAERPILVQLNEARENGVVYAFQGDGRIEVHNRIGTHLVEAMSFDARPARADDQPSHLLNATNRVVRFTGRGRELEELTAWRDGPAPVAVRLVHGGAGQGKTRLAHRFCELSAGVGWTPLRARHSRDVAIRQIEVQTGNALVTASPILVMVDYAERWPLPDLLALLVDRRLHGNGVLRVLLLARPLGNWWSALTHRLAEDLPVDARSVQLAALGGTPEDAQAAFEVARTCFAEALRIPVPAGPAPDVTGSILTIHMAALAHVLAARAGDTPPSDPGELSAYLLTRERSHWQSMFENDRRVQSTPHVMGRAVHVAALTRALDYQSAVRALESAAVGANAGQVIDDHRMCYPPHDPATVLEPLYPDRLAEDFVALQTPGHPIGEFPADPWAAGAPQALLGPGEGNPATVLPLLIDGARRWPHLPAAVLLSLLRERPELAVRAGSPTLTGLAAARWAPPDLLAAVESALPVDPPAHLFAGIAALGERLAAERPEQSVAALVKRGQRQINSGLVEDGLALLGRAVTVARRLAARGNPAELEQALRTLGRAHTQTGNWVAATAALGEAVGLWNDHGESLRPPPEEMARCLTDLSLGLWRQGVGDSLTVRHRAIVQLRRLVGTERRLRLTLARVLVQQAEQLREGARYRDSWEAIDDARKLLSEIAGEADGGLEPDFAAVLIGRARTLQSLRQPAEAAAAAEGAVRILEQLARRNVAFDEDLAGALGVEADAQAALRHWPEAVEAHERAVAIFHRLNGINGARYRLGFARALIGFGRVCRDAGRRFEDALRALSTAVELVRSTPEPTAGTAGLLTEAETIAADLLESSGRHPEAEKLRQAHRHRAAAAQPPPRATPARREPEPVSGGSRDARTVAREIAALDPDQARVRLEQFRPRNILLILLVVNRPYEWVSAVFDDLDPRTQWAILRDCMWVDGLTRYPVMLRLIAHDLLRRTTEDKGDFAAAVLQKGPPELAAAVLSHPGWAAKARIVLAELGRDRAGKIIPLLPYSPGKIQFKTDVNHYWW